MLSTITSTLLIPMMPVVIHIDSGPSGSWTEHDTKMAIAVWLAFTIIGLAGLIVEHRRYKRNANKSRMSFKDFFLDNDSLFGVFTVWPSILVNAVYIICMIIYGIYSIL
jgi:hypothetical protein